MGAFLACFRVPVKLLASVTSDQQQSQVLKSANRSRNAAHEFRQFGNPEANNIKK